MVAILPARRPPTPAVETAGRRGLLVDRAAATAVDLSVCYLLFVVPPAYGPRLLSVPVTEAFNPFLVAFSLVLLVPVHSTYAFAFEWQYARTPGKVARGLTVATTEGRPPSWFDSAVRNLLRYVDLLPGPYLVGLASAARSPRGQRIGDLAAGTVVVRVRD
jgi:uncharacterized RDD family membrane protein YckC